MAKAAKAIPDGYQAAIPYLSIDGAAAAIDFYQAAFGATEVMRMPMPGGRIGHAELRIGDAVIMLADECPDLNFHGPARTGGSPVLIHLYVEDVDAMAARAAAAGATITRPVADQFYGDRSVSLTDPFGHLWSLATRKEDLTAEEIAARGALFGKT